MCLDVHLLGEQSVFLDIQDPDPTTMLTAYMANGKVPRPP